MCSHMKLELGKVELCMQLNTNIRAEYKVAHITPKRNVYTEKLIYSGKVIWDTVLCKHKK